MCVGTFRHGKYVSQHLEYGNAYQDIYNLEMCVTIFWIKKNYIGIFRIWECVLGHLALENVCQAI